MAAQNHLELELFGQFLYNELICGIMFKKGWDLWYQARQADCDTVEWPWAEFIVTGTTIDGQGCVSDTILKINKNKKQKTKERFVKIVYIVTRQMKIENIQSIYEAYDSCIMYKKYTNHILY